MMVSSVAKKELTHEWENERYKDYQESMRNFQSSSKSETHIPKSAKKTSKQEIFLPKTRLSRTGQLLLFTNEDETDLYQTRINSILAKKTYSKKWIEDVGQELNMEAAKFLDERLNENLDTFLTNRKSLGKIIGRNSNFLIQDLNMKSGKDRRLQKVPYLEYLPTNFDPKSELTNALKSLNSLEYLDRTSTSHSNRISGLSSVAEIVDSNSSDDEKNEKHGPTFSRLSSQPILSTKALINKLSSSAKISNNLSTKEINGETNEKPEELVENIPENEIAISYKDTFEPELSTSAKPSSRKAKSSARDDKNDKSSRKSTEFQKNILNSKKILEKRYVVRTQNSSPIANTKTTENSETISISNTKSSKPTSQVNTSTVTKPTTYTTARKKIISPKLTDRDNNRSNLNSLAISGANKYDADDFQNLNSKNQSSFYSSFVNNRAPNTPLPSQDKTFTSASATKPCVHFKPIPDNEDLEPITISVTEIENELTGNSIKIRRFFDRQSIRINKMEIKQEPKQTFSNKTTKSFSAQSTKKRDVKQQLFEENKMEPEIENFSIKLVPKINRTKSAPIKNSSQTNFLLIPNLELEAESNQSDFRQTNDQISEIFPTNETVDKQESSETKKNFDNIPASEPKQDLDTDKVKSENAEVDSSPKKENSVSDKNYLSADYVDNLSISSRVSSVRKNSTDWVYYKNNSEKNETESEAYEKLNKPGKTSSEKKIEETSSSDYQQIMSSRLDSDQEISYKEYYETKYDDTDISGKIDTIFEENSECVAQILANNLENCLSHDQNEEKRVSTESIDQEENTKMKERFIDSEKVELDVSGGQKGQDVALADSDKEIIASQDQKFETNESKSNEINKIDDREEIIMDQVDLKNEVNLKNEENFKDQEEELNSNKLDDVHQLILNEETDSQNEKDIETNIEVNQLEYLEKNSQIEVNLVKENLTEEKVEQIEHQDEQKLEFIDFNPIKDLIESENVKSGTIEISDKVEDFEDSNKRKISISILIKQPDLVEESNSTFGKNVLMDNKIEADKEKNLSDRTNISQVLVKNDQINQIESKNVSSSSRIFDEKDKSSQIEEKIGQISSEKDKNKRELLEFDNKSTASEKQTKKVEFSDHVTEQIIAPSNNVLSKNSNIEKSNLNECKKPTDLVAKQKNKSNLENENISANKKSKSTALTKSIKSEEPKNEIKTKEETADKPSKYKINLSSIDDILGIKNEDTNKDQETKNEPKKIQKPVKESKFERKMREKRERYKNFPYLQLPWDSYGAIVDQESYKEAFSIPDVLNPLIHQINPENTSVDELVLERRILEDKILELRQEKLTILTMTEEERAKMAKKNDKKKLNKKTVDLKVKQDMEFKDRIIREERIRLQNESYKKKIERDNVRKLLDEALSEKEKEIENLEKELVTNQKELNSQLNGIMEQISYLEGTEDQIREVLAQARVELRNRIKQNQQETRRNLREMHEERKESKLFDFNVKKKELEWLLGMYTDSPEELDKIKAKQNSLESDIEQWFFKFENECIDQEKELEDREVEEDNMLITMEHEEEENALKSIKQEQFELLQEKKSLIENFEEIKTKIVQRIEIVKQEKEVMMGEKKQFELNIQMDFERQNQKLLEIIDAEKQAKEEIKSELEQYKQTLFLRREKNLNLKTDLSFLTHSHNITKPFVFSYVMHWPIELFAKPFDQDKIKKSKPKK